MNHLATKLMSDDEKKYVQAQKDIAQALKSIGDLTQEQRGRLLDELLRATTESALYRIMELSYR